MNFKRKQSIVEWAVILPFLLLVIISIVELGPLMNNIQKIEKTAQYAGRQGAIHSSSNDDIKNAVLFSLQGVVDSTKMTYYDSLGTTSDGVKISGYVENVNGIDRTKIEIVPGDVTQRINGGWVMVKITYMHRIYTPIVYMIFDKTGIMYQNKYFPIVRYAIYRIE